jgi:hypothetical protein
MMLNKKASTIIGKTNFTDIHFAQNHNIYSWGIQISGDAVLKSLPSEINYMNCNCKLDNVNIYFMKKGTSIKVRFGGLTLLEGNQQLLLTPEKIISGYEWEKERNFDEICIEGEVANGQTCNDLKINLIDFIEGTSIIHDQKEITLSSLPHWRWLDGDKFTRLTENDENQLWIAINKIHDAIDNKNISQIQYLLKMKTETLSLITKKDRSVLDNNQQDTFKYLFEQLNWKLEPLEKSNIEYELPNPQIVVVKSYKRDPIIQSLPFGNDGKKFSMDLYYAHIDGRWQIIW